MGMPIITPGTGTREQAVTDLVESVALQEAALAHILNAEGEKMQAVIAMPDLTPDKLLELNDSVNKMVNAVTRLEMMFQAKLELFTGDTATPPPASAMESLAQLLKISVPGVTVSQPYLDARDEAVRNAAAFGESQVDPGFDVTFTPTDYGLAVDEGGNPIPGKWVVTGVFTVTKTGDPADSATSKTTVTIPVISSYESPSTASAELAGISVPSVDITVPLTDGTAENAAVLKATAAALALVSPDYSVVFTPSSYDPATGELLGKYTVTSLTNPTDTVTDALDRTIQVVSTIVPVSGASAQLPKILMASTNISLPLSDPGALAMAVGQIETAAQALIDPAYTVTFTPSGTSDITTGMLTGTFTVTSLTDALDSAVKTASVNVFSTPVTSALTEVTKLSTAIPMVYIGVPTDSAEASAAAIDSITSLAESLIAPGYTVTYTNTSYTPATAPAFGSLLGTFTVTSITNLTDTASSPAPVTTPVAYMEMTGDSNALSRMLGGTLLDGILAGIPGLAPTTATYTNGTSTAPDINSNAIDLTGLTGQTLNVSGVDLNLLNFFQLGAANQYAEADANGASKAYAGAVSNDGLVSVGGSPDFPSDAVLDLTQLIPGNPVVSDAKLTIGAITSAVQYNALTNAVKRDYSIAGASLTLVSPAVATFVAALNTVLTNLGDAVNATADTISGIFTDSVTGILNGILGGFPGLELLGINANVSIHLDPAGALAPLLSEPIALSDGSLSLDLDAGSLNIDLGKFWGDTLNGFPPNTPLISSTLLNAVEDGKTGILVDVTSLATNLIANLLNSASISIDVSADLVKLLGTTVAGLRVAFTGTLGDLLSGRVPLTIEATGASAFLVDPILSLVTGPLSTMILAALNALFLDSDTSIVNVAWIAMNAAVHVLTTAIAPIFTIVADVISIDINTQIDDTVTNTYTEIPIRLSLFKGALAEVDLAKTVAGPNSAVPIV